MTKKIIGIVITALGLAFFVGISPVKAAIPLETGGTNYAVYDAGTKNPPDYNENNPGSVKVVLRTYDLHPDTVKQQIQDMCNAGQRKIALDIWFEPWRDSSSTPDLIAVDSTNGTLTSRFQSNLKNVLGLIGSAKTLQGGNCFNEIQIRFAHLGGASPVGWTNWNETIYLWNKQFIYSTRELVYGSLNTQSIKVWFDLGLELGGYGSSPSQVVPYLKRLWKDYTDSYGIGDTYGFSMAWGPGTLPNLVAVYDAVGIRPSQYAIDLYETGSQNILQQLQTFTSEAQQAGEQDKPIILQETYYNDQTVAGEILQAKQLGINVRTVMQWQMSRSSLVTWTVGSAYSYFGEPDRIPTEPIIQSHSPFDLTKFGIFYFLWQCPAVKSPDGIIYDVTKILAGSQNWGPIGWLHWWGEPAPGYYCLTDHEDILKTHAEELRDAGINFVYLDISNWPNTNTPAAGPLIMDPFQKMLKVWSAVSNAPKIVPFVPMGTGETMVGWLTSQLDLYPSLYFNYLGKPLLLATDNPSHVPDPAVLSSLESRFTIRKMWAFVGPSPDKWSWMENCNPELGLANTDFLKSQGTIDCGQSLATRNGQPEEVSVASAYQTSYMSDKNTAVGKFDGRTFRKQFEAVLKNPGIPIVLITSWNEWVSARFCLNNNGQPVIDPTACVTNFLPVISQVKSLRPEYIRIDHVFDYYDQAQLDAVIGDITATGAKPFIALSYMPPSMAQGGDINAEPNNWADWEALVQKTVEHISGKNGLAISGVYYEVWNEPDLFGGYKIGGSKNYLDLYYHTVAAASRASNTLPFKIGGPATTGYYDNWMRGLLNYVAQNNLRLDFLSWHDYSKNMDSYVKDTNGARGLLANYNLTGREMIISEMGPNSENDTVYDGVFGAIHEISTSIVLQNEVSKTFTFEIIDGIGAAQYWGRWGLYTNPKFGAPVAKPRAAAIGFLNNLIGGSKLNVLGQGSWVRAMAKKLSNNVIRILIVNYDPKGTHEEFVPIKLVNLPSQNFTLKRIQFLGGTVSQDIATTSAQWQTYQDLNPNSAMILEATFK